VVHGELDFSADQSVSSQLYGSGDVTRDQHKGTSVFGAEEDKDGEYVDLQLNAVDDDTQRKLISQDTHGASG
jgi:hypothetical protein